MTELAYNIRPSCEPATQVNTKKNQKKIQRNQTNEKQTSNETHNPFKMCLIAQFILNSYNIIKQIYYQIHVRIKHSGDKTMDKK